MMITMQLEQKLTKEQIFEMYCNQVDLGYRGSFTIRGFGEASQAYFGKDIRSLTLPEAAALAAIVRGASYYNPYRHADRVRDALPERPGGGLHPRGEPVLGMTGGAAAPGAVVLDVVQRQPVPGQVELQVEGEAGVPAGEHEPVPAQPLRVGGIVPEDPLEQQVRRGRQAHGGAGVT